MWMVNIAGSYITHYGVFNTSNFHNFLINTMEMLDEDQKVKFIQTMKVNMGMTITENFKQYLFKKLPDSPLLKFF